jgi:hypothetical protein
VIPDLDRRVLAPMVNSTARIGGQERDSVGNGDKTVVGICHPGDIVIDLGQFCQSRIAVGRVKT